MSHLILRWVKVDLIKSHVRIILTPKIQIDFNWWLIEHFLWYHLKLLNEVLYFKKISLWLESHENPSHLPIIDQNCLKNYLKTIREITHHMEYWMISQKLLIRSSKNNSIFVFENYSKFLRYFFEKTIVFYFRIWTNIGIVILLQK